MSRLGAYASTKLNYKLLSKLIIHFFFLVENERKAKTVWTNMHKHTHTCRFHSIDSVWNGYWIPSCANNSIIYI